MSIKLILPIEFAADIEPHLLPDARFVRVDSDGNLDGDAVEAEVYLNWFYLKSGTLHKVLTAAPALRWQHTPSLECESHTHTNLFGTGHYLNQGRGGSCHSHC